MSNKKQTPLMNDGINILQESVLKLSQDIANSLDDKFKEACKIWGVNIKDNDELKKRCRLVNFPNGQAHEFYIDDKLVMLYTNIKVNEYNLNEPFTFGASFRCSEIIKP